MPDYKEMYLKMVRASERAINILIEAQRKCVAKPLAPERFLTVPVQSTPVKQGVLRGKPVLWSWPAFWAGSNRRDSP